MLASKINSEVNGCRPGKSVHRYIHGTLPLLNFLVDQCLGDLQLPDQRFKWGSYIYAMPVHNICIRTVNDLYAVIFDKKPGL